MGHTANDVVQLIEVDAEQMQHGGAHIVDVNSVFTGFAAEFAAQLSRKAAMATA